MAGVKDCYTKSKGSTKTKGNFLYATYDALSKTYGILTPDLWGKQNPEKTFIPASSTAVCQYMKMITLEKVHAALLEEKYEVRVSKPTADKARLAIERMLAIS